MKSLELFDTLKARFADRVLSSETQTGRQVVVVAAAGIVDVVSFLKTDPAMQFDLLTDLGGADYSVLEGHTGPALCVSYQLSSSTLKQRAWLKVYVDTAAPSVPSLTAVYAAANWYERECWDMYGIVFEGHPNLKRLLLYDEFEGHPLRKDYPILKMQPLIPMRNAVDYEAVRVAGRAEGKA